MSARKHPSVNFQKSEEGEHSMPKHAVWTDHVILPAPHLVETWYRNAEKRRCALTFYLFLDVYTEYRKVLKITELNCPYSGQWAFARQNRLTMSNMHFQLSDFTDPLITICMRYWCKRSCSNMTPLLRFRSRSELPSYWRHAQPKINFNIITVFLTGW